MRLMPILTGSVAGLVATIPMTCAMEILFGALPSPQRYPLPPRQVTMNALRPLGWDQNLDETERQRLTLVGHYGMGAAMGAIYGALDDRLPLSGPFAGVGMGLGVWAGNYLGLLPAVGLLSSATQHPARRTALMIAAHVVWGASAGSLLALWKTNARQDAQAKRQRTANRAKSESTSIVQSGH